MAKEPSPSAVFKSYLEEYNLTASKVAADIKLSQSSIRLLIGGRLKISVPIALRLAKYFGNKAEYWLNLQNAYELAESARDPELAPLLKTIPKAKKQVLKVPAAKAPAARAKAARGSAKKTAAPRSRTSK
ncbi:MAG: HigA family addiction module antidote protein [Treponema sp.]|jgi:addiction module HigA family antidote|nr:HigA family addiction module antidote protein [Treponema sp.]